MEEIAILQRIIKISQFIVILISIASFIYLGILTYLKRFEEVKNHLPIVLLGLFLLFSSYSIPVVIFSFLETNKIEKPSEKVEISFVDNTPIPSQPTPSQAQHQNTDQNQPISPQAQYDEFCVTKNIEEAGGDKIRGNVTAYVIKIQDIEFKICVVGSEETRKRLFGPGGPFQERLNWIAYRLYQIKKKVPLIKNQPEWFTVAYIIEVDFLEGLERTIGRIPHRICPEGSKASFREAGGGRSIFFYCYLDFNEENSRRRDEIDTIISHEAAHALDRRAGVNDYLSHKRNSDVYKFIDKYVKAAFSSNAPLSDTAALSAMQMYFAKGYFCNGEKMELKYLSSDFIEPYYEYFADLLAPFLACDSNYQLPERNKIYWGVSGLREKFDEWIRILKMYNFIY